MSLTDTGDMSICTTISLQFNKSIITSINTIYYTFVWSAWRYQMGNPNPYIEQEQTIHWPNEKVQKHKQRSTKTYTWH